MSEHLSKMNVDDGIFEAMEEAGNKPYFVNLGREVNTDSKKSGFMMTTCE
ncbi:hypothetical protein [Paenibacillus sp. FSL K6-1330]